MFWILFVLSAAEACEPCTCGVSRSPRVVGGEATSPGEFPWLAALVRDNMVACGATVVSRTHLLTAAHCVYGVEEERLGVLVGEYDVNNTLLVQGGLRVAQVAQHPDFNRYSYDNDISVLRLAAPLPDHLYRPACLPDMRESGVLEGQDAIVTGWGRTVEEGDTSNIPMKARVQIWQQDECVDAGYGKRKVTPRMICASAPERDSCKGDSGGPLLLPQPHFTLVGVVSWGRGCARNGYPGVYARVDSFLPWLKVALRRTCLCKPPSGDK